MATTKTAQPKSTSAKKAPAAPATADALSEARAAITRARATRADDVDFRDATLSFTYDLWKANMTAIAVMRSSVQVAHQDVHQALIWTEARSEELAAEIIKATPETAEGRANRAAVMIEHILPILRAQNADDWELLPAIISALEVHRADLGMAPFVPPRMVANQEPRETKLMRTIGAIGDTLVGDGTMTYQESIIAALRIVDEAEATR